MKYKKFKEWLELREAAPAPMAPGQQAPPDPKVAKAIGDAQKLMADPEANPDELKRVHKILQGAEVGHHKKDIAEMLPNLQKMVQQPGAMATAQPGMMKKK
jgi:hypothetical protein